MNTALGCSQKKVARVAIDVRLYFDVPVESDDIATIQHAARAALELAADEERIRIKKLQFPTVYPVDAWPTVRPNRFMVCQICSPDEVNRATRFAL